MVRPPVPRASAAPLKPAEVKAISKLAALRKGDPLTETTWPRPNAELPLKIRSLSDEEVVECYAAALKYFEEKGIDLQRFGILVTGAFEDEVTTQILHVACRDFDDARNPFAEDIGDLRANTTPDERAVMADKYRDHRGRVDPSARELTPEEVTSIIDAIKKKDIRRLKGFESSVLRIFLLTMEDPRWSSPTGSVDTSQS